MRNLHKFLLTLVHMSSEGYSICLVCLSVCVSVCVCMSVCYLYSSKPSNKASYQRLVALAKKIKKVFSIKCSVKKL